MVLRGGVCAREVGRRGERGGGFISALLLIEFAL